MKMTIRKAMLSLTRSKTAKELEKYSIEICKEIEKNEFFQKSNIILWFWSLPDEVNTHDIIQKWAQEKTILLPKVVGEKLELYQFTDISNMVVGEFGISEPTGTIFTNYKKIDLCIIPGLAFDKDGGRMGRGKGFYDRFLPQTDCHKMGICFPWQIVPKIDCAPWDIRMDEVVSTELYLD
ncbi:MAG: 5-formyltetrahydrofolate cyclo-ligase [Bacteroidales bacterium]|nr:5-formyltetrahydrofolate cyclo-ligase [Bacteroidales bacterium]